MALSPAAATPLARPAPGAALHLAAPRVADQRSTRAPRGDTAAAVAALSVVAATTAHRRPRRARAARPALRAVLPGAEAALLEAPCSEEEAPSGEDDPELLPVTVLSGFLGSGKTTLLKHILRSAGQGGHAGGRADHEPLKVAVIVNDMGEVNLDASEIKNSRLIQEEATMVELHNGCICCTLRGDLLKTVRALSEEKAFDYLVIESTGISEPLPVAQTFTMNVEDMVVIPDEDDEEAEMGDLEMGEAGHVAADADGGSPEDALEDEDDSDLMSLSNFARLDTMVTVVDALNIFDVLGSLETLAERNVSGMTGNTGESDEGGEGGEEVDNRSIAQLMLDQIEFANVILLSKVHLLKQGPKAVEEIRALLQKLNPSAKVVVPTQPNFADVPMSDMINTHMFDMEAAEESAGWIEELAKSAQGSSGHTPETEEYGISSVVFRNNERPFHPGRLDKMLEGFGSYASSASMDAGQTDSHASVFSGVVRAKGELWMASANAHPIDLHVAGRHVQLEVKDPFIAAIPELEWGEDDHQYREAAVADGTWHPVNGDRGSTVVFIGVRLDHEAIMAELDAALLTKAEMEKGVASWKELEDNIFHSEYFEINNDLAEGDSVMWISSPS